MKIKLNKLTFLFALLILAIGNASLRLSAGGMSSLFRILSPLAVILIYLKSTAKLNKSLIVVLAGILYSVVVSLIGYGNIMFDYLVFAIYIYAVFVIIFDIRETVDNFEEIFWKFLHIITTITLLLAIVQFFVRIPYPFVVLPRHNGVNLFMSNENELALPLGMMALVYLYKIIFKGIRRYLIWFLLILVIVFLNDAKLTLIGCALGCAILIFLRIIKKLKVSPGVVFFTTMGVIILGIFLLYVINPTLRFRDYSINMYDLVFTPIISVLRLIPMPGAGGSMVDRTNAIIYGLKELINSNFLGIGWGNSVTMLATNEYHLLTAKSMHNIIFQFLCEMGIYAIATYFFIIKAFVKNINNIRIDDRSSLKCTFIIAFIVMSAQSSVGILSNYYMWIVVFYVALLPLNKSINFELKTKTINTLK